MPVALKSNLNGGQFSKEISKFVFVNNLKIKSKIVENYSEVENLLSKLKLNICNQELN